MSRVDMWEGKPAYLLLMWNRIPPWQPLPTGQLLIWGRRPWRALELDRLTHA